jgi:hypothetical protein
VVVQQFRSDNLWKWLESTFGEFYTSLALNAILAIVKDGAVIGTLD